MRILALALLLSAAPAAVLAQEQDKEQVYELGELQVTAKDRAGEAIGGSVVTGEQLQTYAKESLDKALDLIPGTASSNTGGSRNERLIFVRGFDRFQTTLSIDGVRVFLPADNRIDFARFLTSDLSEVQVSKGYVPVIDGPGSLGGAINLVTKKPTAPFEGEFRGASYFDRDFENEAYSVSGRIGGVQGDFYGQLSGAYNDRDHFTLSKDFKPVNPTLEDGGERGFSDSNDWRLNAKAGWTPGDNEYALNFTKQAGEKNAPLAIGDAANTRFWNWPYWDITSAYFLSKTVLNDKLTLRSRFYVNTFKNLLSAFDTAAQTTQILPRGFNSYYDDKASGGNWEADYAVSDNDLLKAAFYHRTDEHNERQDGNIRIPPSPINPSTNAPYSEPWQRSKEKTYSLAAENRLGVGDDIDVTVGVSYDWTDLTQADEISVFVTGTTIANSVINQVPVHPTLRNMNAWNGQGAIVWRFSEDLRLHATVSSRERFPTLTERFSSRMGAALPNPDIVGERAVSYEVGAQQRFEGGDVSAAVFYSDLTNALITVPVVIPDPNTGLPISVNQVKNFGSGEYYGAEASVKLVVNDTLEFGGNFTYIKRQLNNEKNPTSVAFRPLGVPEQKAFLYANWRPLEGLTVSPSFEIASDRYTSKTAPVSIAPVGLPIGGFYKTGSYVFANLNVDYAISDKIVASVGGQNLGDEDVTLVDGFPEAGRTFYASLRLKF